MITATAASAAATMSVVKSGVAAALVGIGMHSAPMPAVHVTPVPYVSRSVNEKPIPDKKMAILRQIDSRLGTLVAIQSQELAGMESGGIFNTRHVRPVR
jgi:hypothetical protein